MGEIPWAFARPLKQTTPTEPPTFAGIASGSVETPQTRYDIIAQQATGTAGRLRSGDVAPVLHDLRRRDPSAEMCIRGWAIVPIE
jgi:hypothetical protein